MSQTAIAYMIQISRALSFWIVDGKPFWAAYPKEVEENRPRYIVECAVTIQETINDLETTGIQVDIH